MTVLLVALGAAVGAPLRYLIDRAVQSRHETAFPWGTFAVNMLGSFLLGALISISGTAGYALLGTGFCGALTTYSTFGFETVGLARTRARGAALLNVLASVAVGLLCAWLGIAAFD
jgi:fluoride exporter